MLARLRAPGLALGLLGFALLVIDAGGCGLSTEGVSASCGQDVDCDDGNPCNIDTCESGKCSITALPDGPATTQVPGDCKHATCEGGEAKQETDESDVDDGNPCTIDACVGDEPSHEVVPDSPPEPCSKGDDLIGTCIGGECTVKCTSNDMCTDSNPCTEESCDIENQVCLFPGKHGAFVENTVPGDCLQKVCNETEAVDVPDDTEAPNDGNECTSEVCQNGMVVPTPLPDTPCGVTGEGVCNAAGQCVGCNQPSDCGADPGPCEHWECNSEICQIIDESFGHPGDPALGQTPNDCKLVVCDGNGAPTIQQDAGDLPSEDGNPCTNQTCSGTEPSFPPVAANTPCPNGVCNPTGLCVGCNDSSNCSAAGTCKTVACVNTVCSYSNVPAGQDTKGDCSSNPPCGHTGECNGNGACAFVAGGTVCAGASCSSNVAQLADLCNGSGTCVDGGTDNCAPYTCGSTACKTTCAGNGDCQAPLICAAGGLCREPKGSDCSSGSECATGNCVDGRCCSSASCPNCQDCGLAASLGDCADVPNGTADSPGCTGANVCDGGGNCAAPLGSACTMGTQCLSGFCAPDNVCCDTACTSPCQACVAAKTPSPTNGTCANIDNGTDPDEECSGGSGAHICCNGSCGPNCP
jgi:hypothetical protein